MLVVGLDAVQLDLDQLPRRQSARPEGRVDLVNRRLDDLEGLRLGLGGLCVPPPGADQPHIAATSAPATAAILRFFMACLLEP